MHQPCFGALSEPRAGPRHEPVVTHPGVERVACIDRVKVVLVAVIIAGHGAMSYSDLENAWPYQDVQEMVLPHGVNLVLGALVVPAALFTMGL
jgi:hypothetical protein